MFMEHILYKDDDPDIPPELLDRNGQVVLHQCRICHRAESELDEPCTPTDSYSK